MKFSFVLFVTLLLSQVSFAQRDDVAVAKDVDARSCDSACYKKVLADLKALSLEICQSRGKSDVFIRRVSRKTKGEVATITATGYCK